MKPLHLEVIYAGDHNLSCFYMAEVVEAVAPLFKNELTWDRVYILKKDGARRFYELSVLLYGEEGVRKKQQYAPIPSIFANGRLLFAQIPPVEKLAKTIAGILKDRGIKVQKKIEILVFGATPPCVRCLQAEKEARLAAKEFPAGWVAVEKHDALSDLGRQYGVTITPTILVNGRKVATGRLLDQTELAGIIRKELEV